MSVTEREKGVKRRQKGGGGGGGEAGVVIVKVCVCVRACGRGTPQRVHVRAPH